MAIKGQKVVTGKYRARFPELHRPNDKGQYQVEIIVPIEEAEALNDAFYANTPKLVEFNKATPKAKAPRKLYVPLPLWDAEAGEPVYEDDGETKVMSDTEVVFRFKSKFAPKLEYKKGIDTKAEIGFDSIIQVSANAYGATTKDDSGKLIDFVLLSLNGVRVHELVSGTREEAFDEDDDFETADDFEEVEQEVKPKSNKKDF